jgi:hypothetical protein
MAGARGRGSLRDGSPMLTRRSLITGLVSLVAAPAIVRAGSLMPVKVTEPTPAAGAIKFYSRYPGVIKTATQINGRPLYKLDGTIIRAGDLVPGQAVAMIFNGVDWVMLDGSLSPETSFQIGHLGS